MTSSIFEDWLRKLDKRFKTQRRRVLMIVDNCPAHPKLSNLESITLIFLPPNATSRLQPCDMGIIKNLKVKYRKLVAQRLLDSIEAKTTLEINVLDAMQTLRSAWRDVTVQTVANCFRQAGFANSLCSGGSASADSADAETEDNEDDDDNDDDIPLARLFPAGGDITFADYAAAHDVVETCEAPTTSDIVDEVLASCSGDSAARINDNDNDDEDEDDQGSAAAATVPSTTDAVCAIDTLRRFLYATPLSDNAQEHLIAVEAFIAKGRSRLQQTSLLNFFASQS